MKSSIKKNNYGFRYIYPKPDLKKLNNYYKKKYFKTKSIYKNELKLSEKIYKNTISSIKIFILKKYIKKLKNAHLLDLGAGKGTFLMDVKHNFKSSLGVDFSALNLPKKIRTKIKFISESPEIFINRDLKKFDVITLNNVLEHVPNPILFMKTFKKNIKKGAYVFVCIPNDFSKLQKETNKRVKKKNYWIHSLEHLSYFNKDNFKNFTKKLGFNLLDAISDFPIELFLLKKEFDYTNNSKLGRKIHLLRCEIYSYLRKNSSLEKLYNFSKIIYDLDIGRDYFYLLKKK